MSLQIFHRYCELDKSHEYSIVVPFRSEAYGNYWTNWLWFYIGSLTNGKHDNPRLIMFENSWDKESKLIKTYIDTSRSETCAKRVVAFIQKHYSQKIINKIKTYNYE